MRDRHDVQGRGDRVGRGRPPDPFPAAADLRVGVRCEAGCAKAVLSAPTLAALTRAEGRWRCPRCGRGVVGGEPSHLHRPWR